MGTLDRDFPCDRPPRPSPSLQLSRPYIERRYTASWTGIQVETIDVIRNVPYEFHAVSPSHNAGPGRTRKPLGRRNHDR